jgi:hypothetical protein
MSGQDKPRPRWAEGGTNWVWFCNCPEAAGNLRARHAWYSEHTCGFCGESAVRPPVSFTGPTAEAREPDRSELRAKINAQTVASLTDKASEFQARVGLLFALMKRDSDELPAEVDRLHAWAIDFAAKLKPAPVEAPPEEPGPEPALTYDGHLRRDDRMPCPKCGFQRAPYPTWMGTGVIFHMDDADWRVESPFGSTNRATPSRAHFENIIGARRIDTGEHRRFTMADLMRASLVMQGPPSLGWLQELDWRVTRADAIGCPGIDPWELQVFVRALYKLAGVDPPMTTEIVYRCALSYSCRLYLGHDGACRHS